MGAGKWEALLQVVAAAVRRSVRRWRLARLGDACARLFPLAPDAGTEELRHERGGGGRKMDVADLQAD